MEPQGTAASRTLALLRRKAGALALMVALAWPGVAGAEPKDPKARKYLELGQAALGRDDYEGAIHAYLRALKIEREPKALYLLGQAEFLRGDCRESVRYFTQVKEFEIGREVEEAMRPYLAECAERLLEAGEVPAPVESEEAAEDEVGDEEFAPVPEVDDAPAEAQGSDRGSSRRWYQDPLGDVLVATGVLGAAGGATMLGIAFGRRSGAASYEELEGAAPGIRTLRIAGAATLGVGAALMIGGVIRWGVVARRSSERRVSAGVLLERGGSGVMVRARF